MNKLKIAAAIFVVLLVFGLLTYGALVIVREVSNEIAVGINNMYSPE
jgi:hypothetical protein